MKQPTHLDLGKALKEHCDKNNLTASEGEDHGEKRYLIMPNNVVIKMSKEGKLECSDATIREAISEILMYMDEPEEAAPQEEPGQNGQADQPGKNLPATGKEPRAAPGFNMDAWRQAQGKGYSVAGREAPTAFQVSEESNKRGLCTQIIDAGRNDDQVWATVRVIDPSSNQFREDRVTHDRRTFFCLKSWEDANSQAKYFKDPRKPQLIIGVSAESLPILNPEVMIKGQPAPLWLSLQVMRSWSMADRDAITKAERRAQLKMLNREWREEDEVELEASEANAVKEAIARGGKR